MKREFQQYYQPVNSSDIENRNDMRAPMLSLLLKQWPLLLYILRQITEKKLYTHTYILS